jgi:hypothetical protein
VTVDRPPLSQQRHEIRREGETESLLGAVKLRLAVTARPPFRGL